MKKVNIYLQLMLILFTINYGELLAQTSPMPSTTGTNSVSYNPVLNVYEFNCNGITIYRYEKSNGGYGYNSGATFHAIQALGTDYNWFYPSNVGGITAWLAGAERMPWDAGVTYTRLTPDPTIVGNTVTSYWRMQYGTDYIDYRYDITISGKTLIINVDALGYTKATGINFDRCENAIGKRNVKVPYLTLFNILYSNGGYTSLFTDWEVTNASTIYPLNPSEYTVPDYVSTNSIRFAQKVRYEKKTDGYRNPLKETIYLTVSSNINEVLPNLVGNASTHKDAAASHIILAYGDPYTWLLYPDINNYCASVQSFLNSGSRYSSLLNSSTYFSRLGNSDISYGSSSDLSNRCFKQLHLLKMLGVEHLSVIVKNYQFAGFDRQLPDVLQGADQPANPGNWIENGYKHSDLNSFGGHEYLKTTLSNDIISTLGYGFGLHQQYVDGYMNAPTIAADLSKLALDFPGNMNKNNVNSPYVEAWRNTGDGVTDPNDRQSYLIKPTKAYNLASTWAQKLSQFKPTFVYADVHSAKSLSDITDYDASISSGAGKLKKSLDEYRRIPDALRTQITSADGGFVQGEGGFASMCYAGYFDAIEARLLRADYNDPNIYSYGEKLPLLVDFCLNKIHSKSVMFGPAYNFHNAYIWDHNTVLSYVATEFAYGLCGEIAASNNPEHHTIDLAMLENTYHYPVQRLIANATPTSIEYFNNGGSTSYTASSYISSFTNWDAYGDQNFMGQVKVTYSNGIIVWVNRHSSSVLSFTLPYSSGWFSWNATVNGVYSVSANNYNQTAFTVILPAQNGWFVYAPGGLLPKEAGKIATTEDVKEYQLDANYPNPFNPTTTIKYQLPKDGFVSLKVYDMLGREVANLVNEIKKAGYYEVNFDAHKLASGVYVYTLHANDFVQSKKMILMK